MVREFQPPRGGHGGGRGSRDRGGFRGRGVAASRGRGVATSRGRGVAASRGRGVAASRGRSVAASRGWNGEGHVRGRNVWRGSKGENSEGKGMGMSSRGGQRSRGNDGRGRGTGRGRGGSFFRGGGRGQGGDLGKPFGSQRDNRNRGRGETKPQPSNQATQQVLTDADLERLEVEGGEAQEDEKSWKEFSTMDDLFTSGAFDDFPSSDVEDEERGVGDQEEEVDGFKVEELDVEDSLEQHQKELDNIKQSDPEFFQFLIENDPSLLTCLTADDRRGKKQSKRLTMANADRLITESRFSNILSHAESLVGFQVLMKVLSVASQPTPDSIYVIDDPELSPQIILRTVAAIPPIVNTLIGEEKSSVKPFVPSRRVIRVVGLMTVFWKSLLTFMEKLPDDETIRACFGQISQCALLRWLVPLAIIHRKFVKCAYRTWTLSHHQPNRLAAFMFLHSNIVMLRDEDYCVLSSKTKGIQTLKDERLLTRSIEMRQEIMLRAYRSASKAVGTKFNWRHHDVTKFLENGVVELIRAGECPKMAYRTIFTGICHLGFSVRNAALTQSRQVTSAKTEGKKNTSTKLQEATAEVFSLTFIVGCRIWISAISAFPDTKGLLSFPLFMVISAALKLRLTTQEFLPFNLHCLQLLADMSSKLNIFVPIGSFLFTVGNVAVNLQHAVHGRQLRAIKLGIENQTSESKACDVYTSIRLSPEQCSLLKVAEESVSRFIFVLTDHLGSLARHPAFPESSAPLQLQIRKLFKFCKSDVSRKSLKNLLILCATSTDIVRDLRSSILPDSLPQGDLFVFEQNVIPLGAHSARLHTERRAMEKSLAESTRPLKVKSAVQEEG